MSEPQMEFVNCVMWKRPEDGWLFNVATGQVRLHGYFICPVEALPEGTAARVHEYYALNPAVRIAPPVEEEEG